MNLKMRFEKISLDEGLSQSIVHFISQDSKGLIWISTQEGLNCYDGYKFKVFKNDIYDSNSIPDNNVYITFEDRSEKLWIGTGNFGLSVYDPEKNLFSKILLSENKYNENISSIVEDKKGNIWVGTFGRGLYKISNYEVSDYISKDNLSRDTINCDEVYSLYYDEVTDELYVGTWTGGLNIINLTSMKISCHIACPENPDSISDNRIKHIFKDTKKNIWITTHQNGLNRFNETKSGFIKYLHDRENENTIPDNVLTHICEDHEGMLWIATKNKGLCKYDSTKDNFTRFSFDRNNPHSLSCNWVMCLHVDFTNVLWLGTWGEGICKLDLQQKKFLRVSKNLIDENNVKFNQVSSICVDRNQNFWIGTFNSGAYRSKIDDPSIAKKFSDIEKKSVYCIIEDDRKRIWFSSELHGLCCYDPDNDSFEIYDHEKFNFKEIRIFPILQDKLNKDLLWIGTDSNGLFLFDISKKQFIDLRGADALSNITIYSLYMDSDGLLLIGSQGNGIFIFDTKNKVLVNNIHFAKDMYRDSIWCITEDNIGNLWFGTSNGLAGFSKSSNLLKRFTEADGLINNTINGILIDERNRLWLSTNKGLSRFESIIGKFTNYVTGDGISGNEFNSFSYFKDKNGVMYFGGMSGLTYFDPLKINDNPHKPDIIITNFEIFNKPVTGSPDNPFLKKNITYADEINLTYRESVFSFRFAALIFNNPQKNQYAYKMEGFDKDWTECGTRRRVTYTNLNPGDYVFRVKGSNNDGVWNEEGTSVKIHISPPYWKTVWFKGLSFLSLVGAVGLAYRQRLEKLEKEGRAQEEFSRKLIEVQENEKKRIADDLHDTIAHEILMSKQKAMMALKHKDDKGRMEKTLEEISELTSATITEVRNIAYGLHPHQLDRLGFTKTIKSIINEVSRSTSIKCVFETDNVDELLPKESEINLFRVIQETMTNIIKHSQATEVILKVSKLEDHILILLIDNGKGMNLKGKEFINAKSGFGISTIAERLKIMDGEVSVDSEVNKGTTLRFKIPLKK